MLSVPRSLGEVQMWVQSGSISSAGTFLLAPNLAVSAAEFELGYTEKTLCHGRNRRTLSILTGHASCSDQNRGVAEAAREHHVLAEYAFKQKDTEKAMVEYAQPPRFFPTWPEGEFNLATLCGEAK